MEVGEGGGSGSVGGCVCVGEGGGAEEELPAEEEDGLGIGEIAGFERGEECPAGENAEIDAKIEGGKTGLGGASPGEGEVGQLGVEAGKGGGEGGTRGEAGRGGASRLGGG